MVLPLALFSLAPHTFAVERGAFILDGKPIQLLAAEMHYPRIPEAYWRHRIQMAKAMGLNALSVYCFWNYHETEKGRFNFSGNADVAKFCKIAQEEKMWVLLRPGPYVCAEWEFGGYPYWLQNIPGCVVRKDNPAFMAASANYLKALGRQLAPLQVTHGGNILMVQVENEYGSFGGDHVFMAKNRDQIRDAGFDVPLFTADGEGQMPNGKVDGALPGWNGGGWPNLKLVIDRYQPGGPYFVPEFYPGWLCHWSEKFPRSDGRGTARALEALVNGGASVSFYMFHGGTNFGFWNGANYGGGYQPHITSYDYDAPCDEAGRATAKFMFLRETLAKHVPVAPIPAPIPSIAIPKIAVAPVATVTSSLPNPRKFATPQPMERLGQGYGFVLYRHKLTGSGPKTLVVEGVRDYAVVIVNGKTVGVLDRRRRDRSLPIELIGDQEITIDILVENGGRINFAQELLDNLKGIVGGVTLDGKPLTGWEHFSLPFANQPNPRPTKADEKSPTFYKGAITVGEVGDTFLDMRGWNKGVVWVNGHNLGRYWKIGPQQTLYLPGSWLRKGANDIVILEELPTGARSLSGRKDSILDEVNPEPAKPMPARMDRVPVVNDADLVATGSFSAGSDWKTVPFAAKRGRFLVFETLSSQEGEPYASAAEVGLLGANGQPLDRSKWKVVYADSEETLAEDGRADNILDGDPETIWHAVWSQPGKGHPHRIVIDLGASVQSTGFRYLPRPHGPRPGMTKGYRIYLAAKV